MLHIWITRALFGVSNHLRFPSSSLTSSLDPTQSILACIATNPALTDVFSPVYEYYYNGPMGGYGENLKARLMGYSVKNSEGLQHALELRQLSLPLICTPNDFKQFINNTPMMTNAIAIVAHNAVMRSKYPDEHYTDCFYAIVYEKRDHSDALFIYSSGITILDMEDVQCYFRPKFFLFTPDEIRQSLDISGLYAIQDAKYLMSVLKKELVGPLFLRGQEHLFHLDEAFSYNEESLMDDHLRTMITHGTRVNPDVRESELASRSGPEV